MKNTLALINLLYHCHYFRTILKKGKKRKIDGTYSDSQNPPVPETQIETVSNEIQSKIESKHINDIKVEVDQYFRSLHITCLKLLAIDLINDVNGKTNDHRDWNCFQSKKKVLINFFYIIKI